MYRTADLPAFDRPHAPTCDPLAQHHDETAGYGACSTSGCICQSYAGQGPLCENCTHSYEQHW